MKAGQEQEQEEETSALPWSQLEGRRVGTSPALDGSEGPLRVGKPNIISACLQAPLTYGMPIIGFRIKSVSHCAG